MTLEKRKFLIRLCIVCLLVFWSSCKDKSVIVDINSVINKSNEEVINTLGEPDTTYWQPIFNKKILTAEYTRYRIEFRYFEGKASDIIVRNPTELEFAASTLKRFGLPESAPDKIEKDVLLRWDNPAEDIKMVSFYSKKRDDNGDPLIYEFYFKGK